MQLGGEGTPGVRDFSLGEIALARGTGVTATSNATADTLDLIYRLPETWKLCLAGEAELSIARRVAKLSRHLPADRVKVVDRAVARVITSESGGRVLAVAEAKIIEADPALHEQRVEAERRRRYVSSSRTDEHGLRTIIARVEAGDAVWVEAIVARVAEILAPRHPDATADEVRSIAFGWLARPAELLVLLLEHRDPQETLDLDLRRNRGTEASERRPERWRAQPTSSTRSARSTSPRWHPRRSSTSTSTRPPSTASDAVARVEASARSPSPDSRPCSPAPPDREAGAGPVRPGPDHRLRAPRVVEGTGLPDHRRGLLALRHLHQPQRRLRPPRPL